MAVISVHGEVRHHQPQAAVVSGSSRSLFEADQDEAYSHGLVSFEGSDSVEVYEDMYLAVCHHMSRVGNYKEALEHSTTFYGRNPNWTDNLLLFGAIYYQLHNFDTCIAKNEEALRVEPHLAECYGNMANAWKEKGNVDLAIRYYLALALNPALVDAHGNFGNLMKAQGLVQEAYNCYVEALRIQPTFVIGWSNLAGLFMESGDLNRALQYYKEAIKLKPSFPDAYLNLGNVCKALGIPQEAIVCYQHALQARPNYATAYDDYCSMM